MSEGECTSVAALYMIQWKQLINAHQYNRGWGNHSKYYAPIKYNALKALSCSDISKNDGVSDSKSPPLYENKELAKNGQNQLLTTELKTKTLQNPG